MKLVAVWSYLFGGSLSLAAANGRPCICAPEAVDPRFAVERAAAVFLGTVQHKEQVRYASGPMGQRQRQIPISFTVKRSWKGSDARTIEVIAIDADACSLPFILGKEYVVFGFTGDPRHSPYETEGELFVRKCSPSGDASRSAATIRYLDDWSH